MAKSSPEKRPIPSKKHLARQERENLQRRYIYIGTSVVVLLVIGLIAYGIISEVFLKPLQPVAIVNDDKITTRDFQARVRYFRQQLIGNAINTYQFAQMFSDNPETMSQFVNQLSQIQSQLEPTVIGQQVLDQMIDETLIKQEADRRGIIVTEDEVDVAFQEAFGYYVDGTPTTAPTEELVPTSTLSPLQKTLIPPTATLAPTETPTQTATLAPPTAEPSATPTLEPSPTATEFTFEAFQTQYQETIDNYEQAVGVTEDDLRNVIRSQLYFEEVQKAVLDEIGIEPFEEQAWARHILVEEEATANEVLDKIAAGENWCDLAAQYSTDPSNKDNCGDLGWFGRGRMVPEFEEAAFSLEPGDISNPVETSFGWHIIQSLGKEIRPLPSAQFQQLQEQKFQEWLADLRENSDIEIMDNWVDIIPTEPTLPPEILSFILQNQFQPQPTLPIPTP
jgi:parvulin-like peptidyl-prolyl isomerase